MPFFNIITMKRHFLQDSENVAVFNGKNHRKLKYEKKKRLGQEAGNVRVVERTDLKLAVSSVERL